MKLTIYMKSGNRIVLRGLSGHTFTFKSGGVVSGELQYAWWWFGRRLLEHSIRVDQIEAIVKG